MPTVISSGTKTATGGGTEDSLASDTTNKVYVLEVDTSAMVNGDRTQLSIYTKTLSGGTKHLAYTAIYAHAQANPQKVSMAVAADIYFEASITQHAGTGRAYPWKIVSLP